MAKSQKSTVNMFEIKYLECVTGRTLGSHEEFLRKLQEQSLCLKKVSSWEECDVILAFCPVVSREGTDIEAALKQLPSEIKPAVLVVLHNTFDKDKFVSEDTSVSRENTQRVDCLFHENEGLLNCQRNEVALSIVRRWLRTKVSKRSYQSGRRQKPDNEKEPRNTVSELRLVLLGRTGSGKSAVVNTILGKDERIQAATSTVKRSERRQGELAGRQVTVVDTPDWFSPGLILESVRDDVERCVHLSAPGPHAFLLVLPVEQFAGKESGILEKMEEIFGKVCWRYTVILFTSTDEQEKMDIKKILQSGKQEVQRLVEKCGNRFYCLNIKKSGDGSQVSELLKKIGEMLAANSETFYSRKIYRDTKSKIKEIKNELEERHKQNMKDIAVNYEGEARMEVESNLTTILPIVEESIYMSMSTMQEEFIKQIEEKDKELERLRRRLLEISYEETEQKKKPCSWLIAFFKKFFCCCFNTTQSYERFSE